MNNINIYLKKNAIGFDDAEYDNYKKHFIDGEIDNDYDIKNPYDILAKYVYFDKYNEKPIMWKIVKYDDVGLLLLCEDFLLNMQYNNGKSNSWRESSIRDWLNSSSYGFLNSKNFDTSEINILVESNIETYVANWNKNDLDYGVNIFDTSYYVYANRDEKLVKVNNITDIKNIIQPLKDGKLFNQLIEDGYINYADPVINENIARYATCDKMFLLDEWCADYIYQVFGSLDYLFEKDDDNYLANSSFWLRSPDIDKSTFAKYINPKDGLYSSFPVSSELGVRPVCYIDPLRTFIISGNGTKTEPFILNYDK